MLYDYIKTNNKKFKIKENETSNIILLYTIDGVKNDSVERWKKRVIVEGKKN